VTKRISYRNMHLRGALALGLAAWLAWGGAASPANAPAPEGEVGLQLGPPITLTAPGEVVRLRAARAVRWAEEATTFIYLRGNARIFQGDRFLRDDALLVRMRPQAAAARLEVFARAGARYQARAGAPDRVARPTVFHLRAEAGLVLSEPVVSGDPPPADRLLVQGRAAFEAGAGAVLPPGLPETLVAELRPSAEELILRRDAAQGTAITLRGNAEISGNAFYLTADTIRIRLHPAEGGLSAERAPDETPRVHAIYAEGAADLRRARDRITAGAILLNLTDETGLALDARVRARPRGDERPMAVQFYAEAVRQVSNYRFHCETPGWFSTSSYAKPGFRIESGRIDVVRGPGAARLRETAEAREEDPDAPPPESAVVLARNNVAYVGTIPIFYWPFIARDVTSPTFLLRGGEIGSASRLGTFVKAEWDLYDLGLFYNDWSDWSLLTDYYGDRGFGIGSLFEYELPRRRGLMKAYTINDTADEDDRGLAKPRDGRGQFTLRHREEELPGGFDLDGEFGYLSDQNYLRIYDRDDYDDAKDHETLLFLRRPDANRLFTAQTKFRINDHGRTVERHAAAYDIIDQPDHLFDSGLLWTSHNEAALLHLRTPDTLTLPRPDSVVRLHTDHELSYPFATGPLRWVPYGSGGVTFFSEQAGDASARLRRALGGGLRGATNLYRTYRARSEALGIDDIRHILTPTLDYVNRFHVSDRPGRFVQHDEIDALDNFHRLPFGLHNRLQTHRRRGLRREVVDFLTFDLDLVQEIDNLAWMGKEDTLVEANMNWRLSDILAFDSEDNRFNLDDKDLERLNGRLVLDLFKPIRLTLGQSYYRDTALPNKPSHHVTRLGVIYQPAFSRWKVETSLGRDWTAEKAPGDTRDPRDLEGVIAFHRQLDDWTVVFEVELNAGRRGSTSAAFRLVPPGGDTDTVSYR
jgi:hypothetical protein